MLGCETLGTPCRNCASPVMRETSLITMPLFSFGITSFPDSVPNIKVAGTLVPILGVGLGPRSSYSVSPVPSARTPGEDLSSRGAGSAESKLN